MKTISGLANFKFKSGLQKTVVVIGVFDGLHRGHQYLVSKAVSMARRLRRKSICLTFHPHPRGVPYLISLKHRLKLIESAGIDYTLVAHFTKEFARISAKDFIDRIIGAMLSASYVFVGRNFRFGHNMKGNVSLLKHYGERMGFKVVPVKELKVSGLIASSNTIRSLIKMGNLVKAEKLLGRKVSVLGTVIPGLKRGRILGHPTANINPHHEVLPRSGVYAVKIFLDDKVYSGICNIGRRPTFSKPPDEQTVEAHIFDFKKDIYGQDLEIQFILEIRGEKKFPSSAHLSGQIRKDEKKALKILSSQCRQ